MLTLQLVFTANGEDLELERVERVEVFKYLGRLLAYDDRDTKAMWTNLKKA